MAEIVEICQEEWLKEAQSAVLQKTAALFVDKKPPMSKHEESP